MINNKKWTTVFVFKLFLNVNYTVIFFFQFHFYIALTSLAFRKFLNNPEDNVCISQDSSQETGPLGYIHMKRCNWLWDCGGWLGEFGIHRSGHQKGRLELSGTFCLQAEYLLPQGCLSSALRSFSWWNQAYLII